MAEDGPHDAVGAYVLDALPDDDRRAFEAHAAACPECTREVAALGAVAARLGEALAADPPPGLRERVLRAVGQVAQEGQKGQEGQERHGAEPVADVVVPVVRPRRRVPAAVLAAVVAAVLGLGGLAVWQWREAADARAEVQRAERQAAGVADVLAAPDVQVRTKALAGAGRATVAVSRGADVAAFFATGLPALPAGKTYELWFGGAGAYRPAGLLPGAGDRQLRLEGPVAGATAVCVTVEPAGGSPAPTGPVVAWIGLPSETEQPPAPPPDPDPDPGDFPYP
ncbi:anti-sigma factor [Streptomyces bambusae]|uniref:anti-sigma factor n=1 Tax=Streptomyces bambusae TaxID=1550616 RepID=UPI001CFD3510|nr:anti-sigma factor [Streptomyces bambusae]MCB5167540.1 anti-sigma factor [Streptomyces bambusae]